MYFEPQTSLDPLKESNYIICAKFKISKPYQSCFRIFTCQKVQKCFSLFGTWKFENWKISCKHYEARVFTGILSYQKKNKKLGLDPPLKNERSWKIIFLENWRNYINNDFKTFWGLIGCKMEFWWRLQVPPPLLKCIKNIFWNLNQNQVRNEGASLLTSHCHIP